MNLWQLLRARLEAHPVHTLDPRAGYDRWASRYASEENPILQLERGVLEELLPGFAGKRVLDAGCGAGWVAALLAEQGAEVVGIDFATNMLQAAREGLGPRSRVRLAAADVRALPFLDGRFDGVTCSLVLGHVEELDHAVGELARVTRPGGSVLISDFHPFGHLLGWHRSCLERPNGKLEEFRIRNFPHLYEDFFRAFQKARLHPEEVREPRIDESVKHFFDRSRNGREVYKAFQGVPAVLVFRLTRL